VSGQQPVVFIIHRQIVEPLALRPGKVEAINLPKGLSVKFAHKHKDY
jgi:hypothetical protein